MVEANKRDSSIEWLRVVSALGIVWFHAGVTGSYWGYAGLIIFLMLSLMFAAGPNIDREQSVPKLALRLLLPWVFWWAVYAALNLVRGKPTIDASNGVSLGVLAGPSLHLWYLPFAFVALALFGLVKGRLKTPAMAIGAACIVSVLIWTIPDWRPWSLEMGPPVAQWTHAIVPILMGLILGCCLRVRWAWALVPPLLILAIVACLKAYNSSAAHYLIGLSLVVAIILTPASWRHLVPAAPAVFGAMLGVYLLHPLALAVLRPVTERVEVAGVAIAFLASLGAVLAAAWIAPWPSHLLLGTSKPQAQRRTLFRARATA